MHTQWLFRTPVVGRDLKAVHVPHTRAAAAEPSARKPVGLWVSQWRNAVPELGPCGRTWVRSVIRG